MIDLFKGFFKKESSSQTAKDRLRLVLMSDHLALAPDVIAALKADLLAVISRYVEIDPSLADVTFESRERDIAMLASIPILSVRDRGPQPPSGGGGSTLSSGGGNAATPPRESTRPSANTNVAFNATRIGSDRPSDAPAAAVAAPIVDASVVDAPAAVAVIAEPEAEAAAELATVAVAAAPLEANAQAPKPRTSRRRRRRKARVNVPLTA